MKLYKLIFLPLIIMLMGFSDAKVSSRNAENLDASLQVLLKPLSQKERVELMESFFLVAYGNHPDVEMETLERAVKGPAKVYITSRRMDTDYKLVYSGYLFGNGVHGNNTAESFFAFIEDFGDYVDGKSGHEILREGRALREKSGKKATQVFDDETAKLIAEVEANLEKWNRTAPQFRAAMKSYLMKLGTRPGAKGIPMTQCDVSIAQGILHLDRLRTRGDTNRAPAVSKTNDYVRGDRHCAARNLDMVKMMPAAAAMFTVYVPENSPLPAALSGSVSGADASVDMAAVSNAQTDRAAKALGYIRIVEYKKFKITTHRSSAIVKMGARVKIHNLSGKPVKRVHYGIAIAPKSDPTAVITLTGKAPSWNEDGPLTGVLFSSTNTLLAKTIPAREGMSSNKDDYIFTPYVTLIQYVDGTMESFVPIAEMEKIIGERNAR
ncbi:MAG: hypothetical protein V3U82_00080 [Robiginitomaculum sp.]